MRIPLLAGALALATLPAMAQNVYTVCDVVEEFCFCWDGTLPAPTFTFIACQDSAQWGVQMVFCSGSMDPTRVLRGYDGTNNSGQPIPGLTGSFANMMSLQGGGNNAVHLELDFSAPNAQNCMSGAEAPWRFLVWTGNPDPWPMALDCLGTDPFCSLTGVAEHTQPGEAWIAYANGNLLLPPALAGSGTLAWIDPEGRTVRTYALDGSVMLPMGGDLVPGAYVAVLTDGSMRRTGRVLVMEP